jgi:PAS domain S-box-containing protein
VQTDYDPEGISIPAQREAGERLQMEAALRSSEERFSKAFRASPVALAILQRAGGVFVDVNDRFAELAEGTRESIIGQAMFSLPLWSEPRTRTRIEHFLIDGEPLRNWQCQIAGAGDRQWKVVRIVPATAVARARVPGVRPS